MIKCVVFDLDDTLYAEKDYNLSGFQAVADWLSRNIGVKGFYPIMVSLFNSGRRNNLFNQALDIMNFPYDSDLINQLLEVYRCHKPNLLRLYDDAISSIQVIKNKYKLGIITDGYLKVQQNKIAALGLTRYFENIICTDQLGREFWKPSPIAYERMMEFFQATGSQCVYVGDNPRKDFFAPRKLGWKTVQISRNTGFYSSLIVEEDYKADREINSLLELERLLIEFH